VADAARNLRSRDLPDGVLWRPLAQHGDQRGSLSEIFRQEWATGIAPVQWVLCRSHPGVLRGVHVHPGHADYLIVIAGHATVGLHDLRPRSPTSGRAVAFSLRGSDLVALTIPPGVAHGFLFHEASAFVLATDSSWSADDDLGCHWADPALGIDWPSTPTSLSERDATAPPLARLVEALAARRGR
jgi:dTDP-4-dehydrorhamnose 3,5-epimerase